VSIFVKNRKNDIENSQFHFKIKMKLRLKLFNSDLELCNKQNI